MEKSSQSNSSNDTPVSDGSDWPLLPFFLVCVLISGILLNTVVLSFLLTTRCIQHPFNIYLINLMVSNLAFIIVQNPLEIANQLSPAIGLSFAGCTMKLYGDYVISGSVIHAHLLISMNQLWALSFPTHYRAHHTRAVALALCVSGWVYVHLTLGYGWAMDAMYYRDPHSAKGCVLNITPVPQLYWGIITQFLNFNVPICWIIASFTIVAVKRSHHLKKRNRLVQDSGFTKLASAQDSRCNPIPVFKKTAKTSSSHSFRVLLLQTLNVLITWTPAQVYYTMIYFGYDQALYGSLLTAGTVLFSLQGACDPLLFTYTAADVKQAMREFLQRCSRYAVRGPRSVC